MDNYAESEQPIVLKGTSRLAEAIAQVNVTAEDRVPVKLDRTKRNILTEPDVHSTAELHCEVG